MSITNGLADPILPFGLQPPVLLVGLGRGEVLRLDAGNFELAVQSYACLAVLFYDHSPSSPAIVRKWEKVRVSLSSLSLRDTHRFNPYTPHADLKAPSP